MADAAVVCLFLLLSGVVSSEPDKSQTRQITCPDVCTCHHTPRGHVPLVRWHETGDGDDDTQHHWSFYHQKQGLNVSTADGEDEQMVLSTVCVLQKDTDAAQLMAGLSPDTQFLSLLQAPDMQPTYLRAAQFAGLPHLQGLEIQGFHTHHDHSHDHQAMRSTLGNELDSLLARAGRQHGVLSAGEAQQSHITLSHSALRPLSRLQYVNLEYVLLSPSPAGEPERQYRAVPLAGGTGTAQSAAQHGGAPPAGEAAVRYNTVPLAGGVEPAPAPDRLLVEELPDIVPYEEFRLRTAPHYATFANMTALRFLRLAHAGIEELSRHLFEGLTSLEHLIVEHQRLTSVPDRAFAGCPSLRRLSLAHNRLTLSRHSLAGLTRLQTLDLSHNLVTELGQVSAAPLPQLRELNLHGNPAELLYPAALDTVNGTEVLRLGAVDTPIAVVPHALDAFSALRELSVANLSVATLTADLFRLPELVSLQLHGHVERVEFDAFGGSPRLERLDLSRCRLEELSQDSLLGLRRLRLLDLSHNRLTELPSELLSGLPRLREVYLHHNRLSWLSPDVLGTVRPKLLQLHHNPWRCNCQLAFLSATVTNKVRSSHATICRWDSSAPGGRLCQHERRDHLTYDVRVEPRCHEPPQYRHWGVYEVLQRELRCRHQTAPPPPVSRSAHLLPSLDGVDYQLTVAADAPLDDYADDDDYELAEAVDDADQMAEYAADDYEAEDEDEQQAGDQQAAMAQHTPEEPDTTQDYATISPDLFAKLSKKAQKLERERLNPKFRKHYNL